ncbi:MAG: methyltransferase domain-containing protein [Gammaproteobacteria bacterium]|nr:methyltransferase domain-containing protein [Gammaproteobacteria bacterium]
MLSHNPSGMFYVDPSPADIYSKNNLLQYELATQFLHEQANLLGTQPVLDVGCGTGELTAYIANTFQCPVTGIDISSARINYANQQPWKTDSMQFINDNIIALDSQRSSQYYRVVSFNALHHIPQQDQLAAFKNIHDIMPDEGIALLLVPARSPTIHDVLLDTANSPKWEYYFSDFILDQARTWEDERYYSDLCGKAGFACSVVTREKISPVVYSYEEMKNFVRGWLPHLAHMKQHHISDDIQELFLDDITKNIFAAMKTPLDQTITPIIIVNKIIAYNNRNSFFNSTPTTNNSIDCENDSCLTTNISAF